MLKVWEGAGYYARARHLRAAAQQLVRDWNGALPHRSEELRQLPGVGPYIAAAVASLAFHQPDVALDANGLRVLARWTLERADPRRGPVHRRLYRWAVARRPPTRAGDFNEALMELGETVCLPVQPRCERCPVAAHCPGAAGIAGPGSSAGPETDADQAPRRGFGRRRSPREPLARPPSTVDGTLGRTLGIPRREVGKAGDAARRRPAGASGRNGAHRGRLGAARGLPPRVQSLSRGSAPIPVPVGAGRAPHPGKAAPLGGVDRAPAASVAPRYAQDDPFPGAGPGPG